MRTRDAGPSYLLLFAPYGLATLFAGSPVASFLLAWAGSFFIIAISLSGIIKPLPRDRTIIGQVLRPIVLLQLVFISYTALTAIFTFLDANGFRYFTRDPFAIVDDRTIELLAAAQRLYVLAHAGLVAGLLAGMNYRAAGTWRLRATINVPKLLTAVAVISVFGAIVGRDVGIPIQITNRFEIFGLVASVLALTVALRMKEGGFTILTLAIYATNLVAAVLSGWKEEVAIVLMLLALFAYPMYKRTVIVLTPIVVAFMLFVLPAYTNLFRQLNWYGGVDQVVAAKTAVSLVSSGAIDLRTSTWDFLAHRSSEIGMFTRYIRHTPEDHPFYGTETLRQAVYGLVPRFVWKNKPSLERLAMERAYANGITTRDAHVSTKPQFVADAYLCAGAFGVVCACLIYGWIASTASRISEYCFGGYLIGSGLMFNALFMSMWRGNAFEFILNDILWGFLLLGLAFVVTARGGWIVRATSELPARRSTPRAVAIRASGTAKLS